MKNHNINDLETPALLIDVSRVEKNVRRYQDIANREGIKLRPHGKTSKLEQIWDMQRTAGCTGLTVATVREAEVAMINGHRDIFIAYPHVDPKALKRISDLVKLGNITLLISNKEGADIVYDFFKTNPPCPFILLAIDTGLHREGVLPQHPKTIEFIKYLAERFGGKFRGITTHEGHSYKTRQPETVASIAKTVRDTMIKIKRTCEKSGIHLQEVAIGATPTFAHFKNDGKHTITEAHPGNYVFFDATQVNLGIAEPSECALTVLAQVIDKRTVRTTRKKVRETVGIVYVNAGSKTVSEAKRPHSEGGTTYGKVFSDMSATELDPDASLRALSEEIGWLEVPLKEIWALNDDGHPIWSVGQKVRLLVQHACPVVACNTRAWLVDGEKIIGPAVIHARGYERYGKRVAKKRS